MISRPTLDRIRHAVNLRQLVQEWVRLNQNGIGLCPFHSEKTPSFRVYEDGHYYCYGCNESGDAFTFMMKIESVSFSEACRLLSERTGISLDDVRHQDMQAEGRARVLADRTAKMAAWYWREQRIIARRKRSAPMLDWINRLTAKEMIMIWKAEWTSALEVLYHQDEQVVAQLKSLVETYPEALAMLDQAVTRRDVD
jgi:CHC2 zinc finger